MWLLRLRSHNLLSEKGSLHPGSDIAFEMHFHLFDCIVQPHIFLLDCNLYLTPLIWAVSL